MKKRIILILFALTLSSNLFSQKLSLTDLSTLCNQKNWQSVNQLLLNKGWTYYDSKKGDSDSYNTISWSFNKDEYSDKALGWFYLYTFEGYPNKISYSIFNKPSYLLIQNSLITNGFKLIDSEIEDEKVISTYSNTGYILKISNAKRKDDDWSDSSYASYNITLIKKSGIYDHDNGKKTEYYDDYTIKSEYNLLNGKLNGTVKLYYENGNIKKTLNYSNGVTNGKVTEYDENGFKTAEYNSINDQINGLLTYFEDNKISYTATYQNGVKNGIFTQFYYTDDNEKIFLKESGQYLNDKKNGTWKTFYSSDKTENPIRYFNYINDIKEGQFQKFQNDSLIIGHFKNDKLDGNYKIYYDFKRSLFGGEVNTNISDLLLIGEGQYKEDQKTGYWKEYSISGSLISDGNYSNDKQQGEWNYYNPNYVNENGISEPYAKKLTLKSNYLNGKLDGNSERFYYQEEIKYPCDEVDENGVKKDTCIKTIMHKIYELSYYKNDELNGVYELRDSINQMIVKGQYKDDLKEGKWFKYKKDNNIDKEINYRYGLLDGEYIEFNENYKPIKVKQFKNNRIIQVIINDSTGMTRRLKFDIIERNNDYLKVNKTEYLDNGIVSRVYRLKNDAEDEEFFELIFALQTSKELGGDKGYTDGEYLFTTLSNEPIVSGKLYKDNKIDKWTHYYYEQKVKIEEKYIDNVAIDELYLNLDNSLFSGQYEFLDTDKNTKQIRKIKNGLRNGKTTFVDMKTNKTINKVNYKDGKLH